MKKGDIILVDDFLLTTVEKVDEPDRSSETGRIYQEIYFDNGSHCDISRCKKVSDRSFVTGADGGLTRDLLWNANPCDVTVSEKMNESKDKKMTSRDFVFWLQGYFEISMATAKEDGANTFPQLDREQIENIQKHLNLIFKHEIDPSFGGEEEQSKLNSIHGNDAKVRC